MNYSYELRLRSSSEELLKKFFVPDFSGVGLKPLKGILRRANRSRIVNVIIDSTLLGMLKKAM